jgi:apolipoprotein N-acyltransferase
LLRATNTGISAIINAQGKIISQAPQFKITTLQGIAQPQQGLTPYMRFGNYLIILFLSSLLIGNYLWIYLKDNHNSSSN